MSLGGKRVLFLSANLFGYQFEIKKCIECQGAIVDYFDERPANTFFIKAVIRINRNFLSKYIDKYHENIILQTLHNQYDFVFITKGESISVRTLSILREKHPKAKFIIYHWDSIANNKNAIRVLPLFDKIFSFDRFDCQRMQMDFLPLFFLEDYKNVTKSTKKQDIDLLFIGTAHSDRYKFIQRIAQQFVNKGLNIFVYIYFPSPILYYKKKFLNKSFFHTKKGDFHYIPISKKQIIELYIRSKVIVDIQHPHQTGLTMRTIETLGAERKLITTNTHIQEYDFYDQRNILVVNRENPIIQSSFFDTPYYKISNDIYEKYSIVNWISTIFK